MTKKSRITKEKKQKIMEAYATGISMREVAKITGTSLASVSRIVKEKEAQPRRKTMKSGQGKTDRQKKIEDLERRILELERKILAVEARRKAG